MDSGLKQRLIGAAVLVAIAVIFLPMLVQGPAPDSGVSDVPLTMPDTPQGDYTTRDLPLVTPGAAPRGGAVGLDTRAEDSEVLPMVDTASAAPVASQALPMAANEPPAPTAAPLPASPPAVAAAKPEPMLPATTAGGDYAVHFGAYATAANAATILRQLRGSQLPGYSERTTVGGKPAYRVRIGPYATRAEAEAARLRAAHVRDDVTARVVVLDAEAVAAQVAAKPAVATAALPPAPDAPVASKPVATPPVAAPAPQGTPAAAGVGFAVQLGAFSKADDATALRDRLRGAGFNAFTESVSTDKGTLTRVRVGPVIDRAAANQLQAQVKAKVGMDGLVRPHP